MANNKAGTIPTPKADDHEDVSWALTTAATLWERGDRADALNWLRRAARAAAECDDDDRALELSKAVAVLSALPPVRSGAAPAPKGAPASPPPPPDPAPKSVVAAPAARGASVPPPAARSAASVPPPAARSAASELPATSRSASVPPPAPRATSVKPPASSPAPGTASVPPPPAPTTSGRGTSSKGNSAVSSRSSSENTGRIRVKPAAGAKTGASTRIAEPTPAPRSPAVRATGGARATSPLDEVMTNLLPAAADGPDMSESTTVMVGANVGPLLTRAEDKSSGGRSLAAMLGLCQALPVHLVRRDGVVTITLAPPGSEAPEGAVEAILVARQASTDLVDFLAGGGAPRARGSRDRRGSR